MYGWELITGVPLQGLYYSNSGSQCRQQKMVAPIHIGFTFLHWEEVPIHFLSLFSIIVEISQSIEAAGLHIIQSHTRRQPMMSSK